MGLLTPKGKKNDKKNAAPKANQGSKFISSNKNTKTSGGFSKKPMTGGTQRGS